MHVAFFSLLAAFATAAPTEDASNPCSKGCPTISSETHFVEEQLPAGNPSAVEYIVWPWLTYKSSPLQPPAMLITGPGSSTDLDDSYIFFGPHGQVPGLGVKQPLAVIMDNDGNLVHGINQSHNFDFRVQMYDGKPHLTYWFGQLLAWGYGQVRFLDETLTGFTFSPTANINPSLPALVDPVFPPAGVIDLHEHNVADGKTIVVTHFNATPGDLTEFGIKGGWVMDSLVAEYDIKTGKQLFIWSPADHVPFNRSFTPIGSKYAGTGSEAQPWDWCHCNSAQKIGENYLINARHLWSTFLVAPDGHIIWELNGETGGDFGMPPESAHWSWGHHVRAVNDSIPVPTKGKFQMTMWNNHDNGELDIDQGYANALMLELTLPPNKNQPVKILRNLTVPSVEIVSPSQGAYTPYLSNGNAFVGTGDSPYMREFSPKLVNGTNQQLLRQWEFGTGTTSSSFRAFKFDWKATPAAYPPSLVVEKGNGSDTAAYVSWNGATEVKFWDVYTGASSTALKFVGRAAKKGFETVFSVAGNCVQVAAVQGGKEVKKSNVACL